MTGITAWDGNLLITIQDAWVCDGLTPIATFITHLGDKGMLWIALILLMLCFKKTRKVGIIALTALAISFAINNGLLKNVVARPRPYDTFEQVRLLVGRQHDYSFPSGHSAASFVTATVMFRKLPYRYGVPALVMALLIALSRLYVGVHYPLDVLAGSLSGACIALIVCAIFDWNEKRKELSIGTDR